MNLIENHPIVVGIGASAGGLECFKEFFSEMPQKNGMAFVLIQHLAPHHNSLTAQLLSGSTSMPVKEIEDKMQVEANHVYVIPPNKLLEIKNGVLRLKLPRPQPGGRRAIDHFFCSLAQDQVEKSVGIILSGAGEDGVEGCRVIKERGGLVIAQDPTTAAFSSMPQSLVSAGVVDHVAPIHKIPDILLKHIASIDDFNTKISKKNDLHLTLITDHLKKKTKDDFSSYKKATLLRRIHRRMESNKVKKFAEYFCILEDNMAEVEALHKDLMIRMTSFFRNPECFETLAQKVQPNLTDDFPFRVWVPGCSTGEEAYSIAMLFMEDPAYREANLQIFATDIDEEALEIARRGIYPKKIEAQISPERLEKFFDKAENNYHVKPTLRRVVMFTKHNLISDTPFCKLDLISCRNLFIYIEPEMQKEILRLFHFSLKPRGYLFLGMSETIGREDHLFEVISKKSRLFRRIELSTKGVVTFTKTSKPIMLVPVLGPEGDVLPRQKNLFECFKQQLVEEHIPASVLINMQYEVLYLFGSLNRYLKLPQGIPHLNLMTIARGNLSGKLRKAVQSLVREKMETIVSMAYIEEENTHAWVEFKIAVFKNANGKNLLIVTFKDIKKPASKKGPKHNLTENSFVKTLEHELNDTRTYLQNTIEDLESANEELKISNEEIMSMNEELQAASEEMETSKEELQSLNEELTVVNAQLQEKIDIQDATNDDLVNLLKSTNIATIFLDQDFYLKRFTPEALKFFNFIPTDVGRPISDITVHFEDPCFITDAKVVLENCNSIEREIRTKTDEWYLRKILAYKTEKGKATGIVITFSNVTAIKNSQEFSKKNEKNLLNILDSLPVQIAYVDHKLKYRFNNKHHAERSGLSAAELAGKSFNPPNLKLIKPYIKQVLSGQTVAFDNEDETSCGEIILIPDIDVNGKSKGFFMLICDITDRRQAALELKKANEMLERKVAERTKELQKEITNRNEAENNLRISYDFLKAVIDAVPDSTCVKDEQYRITIANKAFCNEFASKKEAIGSTIQDFSSSKREAEILTQQDRKASKKGFFEGRMTREDQTYDVKIVCLKGPQRKKYLLCSYQNISKLLSSEKKLTHTVKQLKASNEDLKNFAYICSHDLQEPSRTILNFAKLLMEHLKEFMDEETKKYLHFILDGSNRMQEMIKGALIYAKVAHQGYSNELVDCDILLKRVLETLHTVIEEAKLNITYDHLPHIIGDSNNIMTVLQNLISNSLKFRNHHNPQIHIGVTSNKSGYIFSVKDNGIGIDMAHKGHIFDLFHRLNKEEEYPGTGIGLAVCKKIISMYGGKLWVESEVGNGSTFYFTIPQKLKATQAHDKPSARGIKDHDKPSKS
jgi:PAS domain S-box-containing protein